MHVHSSHSAIIRSSNSAIIHHILSAPITQPINFFYKSACDGVNVLIFHRHTSESLHFLGNSSRYSRRVSLHCSVSKIHFFIFKQLKNKLPSTFSRRKISFHRRNLEFFKIIEAWRHQYKRKHISTKNFNCAN